MPVKLDSHTLEVFVALCDSGSMTAAAQRLGVTQGAVSQKIARLEAMLGVTLIDRRRRELLLLPAGLQLRHHARRVLAELRDAEGAMRRLAGFSFPRLTVGVMETLSDTLTGTILRTLKNVVEQIQVAGGPALRHRKDLFAGRLDMVLTARAFREADLEIHTIAREPLVLVVPKGFLDDDGIDLDRLSGSLPLLRLAARRHISAMANRYLSQQVVPVVREIELDHASLVFEAVRAGHGWAITTPFGLLQSGPGLAAVDVHRLPGAVPQRTISLIARRDQFAALPATLAAECRAALRQRVDDTLVPSAPRVAGSVTVPDG